MISHSSEGSVGSRQTAGSPGANTLFEEYEPIINQILSVIKVPNDIRDDCYQAACLGLLKAEQKRDKVKFFKSYAIRCMKNEIIIEVAKLRGPGNGVFALDAITFLLLSKYKKALKDGDTSSLDISEGRENDLNRLLNVRRFEYAEGYEEESRAARKYD